MLTRRICPTVLAADFTAIGDAVHALSEAGCDHLHLDIMDGHYVPPITFGAKMVQDIRGIFSGTLDVHLMVTNPLDHLTSFAEAGADLIYVHLETIESVADVATMIRKCGKKSGIALYRPDTQRWDDLLAHISELDAVLVAMGSPGYAGKPLEPDQFDKVRTLRESSTSLNIMVDIGINERTLPDAQAAGANWFAASSAIFSSPLGIAKAYQSLNQMTNP